MWLIIIEKQKVDCKSLFHVNFEEVRMDTQLCKAKSISSGQWVCGYYVKGLDMHGKEIHIIFEPTTVFYSHGVN